ncbi:TPA: hypothetical protein I8P18_003365 [Salmonella enterica subsp. enterica serovar Napoli]|nr:hypothetical protein [Salmonella enterica subsp. enterica serovar Napoli]
MAIPSAAAVVFCTIEGSLELMALSGAPMAMARVPLAETFEPTAILLLSEAVAPSPQ